MKTTHALALFALNLAPVAAFAACEGEPPVLAPENASAAPSAMDAGAPPAAATPDAMSPVASASASTTVASGCLPCAAVVAAPAVGSDGSAPVVEASAEPIPPVPMKRGTISGIVTSQPANVARTAIVYLEEHPGDADPSHQTVKVDNRQMNFIPYVSVVAVDGRVVFENEDPFPHNVFSPDNDKFNLGNIPQNGAIARVFHRPGAYTLLCNLHPGMVGYLLVTPSIHFVRTDAKGAFSMKEVPVGAYHVSVWAPRQKPVTEEVTVIEGDAVANFDIHR